MGAFYDFYREMERRANVTVRISIEGGPVLWEDLQQLFCRSVKAIKGT